MLGMSGLMIRIGRLHRLLLGPPQEEGIDYVFEAERPLLAVVLYGRGRVLLSRVYDRPLVFLAESLV